MAFYKVVLNGQCQGQDVKNILYYRTGIGIDISGLTIGGTLEVANAVRAMVWPAMKLCLPTAYQLQSIDASVYNDGTFDLLYQSPTNLGVGEAGSVSGNMNGPAPCAIINFELEPTLLIANGAKPPRKGYMALGPLVDTWILDNGSISTEPTTTLPLTALCAVLSNNIETLIPPAVFFPVRMHQDKVLGLFRFTSFADIRGAHWRFGSSFRRSRMPEL